MHRPILNLDLFFVICLYYSITKSKTISNKTYKCTNLIHNSIQETIVYCLLILSQTISKVNEIQKNIYKYTKQVQVRKSGMTETGHYFFLTNVRQPF